MFKFNLVGHRRYVRATDIVRTISGHVDRALFDVEFLRPLRSNAIITHYDDKRASVRVRVQGSDGFALKPVGPRAEQIAQTSGSPRALTLSLGSNYIFLSRKGLDAIGFVEASFDIVHPKLSKKFVVSSIETHERVDTTHRILWTRFRPTQARAAFTMTGFGGPAITIHCRQTSR